MDGTGSAATASSTPAPPSKTVSSPLPPQVKVIVKGRVQGVGFRDWTVENAEELGLRGWVRNRRDGSVEALFSGDPAKVDEMVERRCPIGAPAAAVTAVRPSPSDEDPGPGGFRCLHTV